MLVMKDSTGKGSEEEFDLLGNNSVVGLRRLLICYVLFASKARGVASLLPLGPLPHCP